MTLINGIAERAAKIDNWLVGIGMFLFLQFLVWYAGADMFERSGRNALILIVILFVSVVVALVKKGLKL